MTMLEMYLFQLLVAQSFVLLIPPQNPCTTPKSLIGEIFTPDWRIFTAVKEKKIVLDFDFCKGLYHFLVKSAQDETTEIEKGEIVRLRRTTSVRLGDAHILR